MLHLIGGAFFYFLMNKDVVSENVETEISILRKKSESTGVTKKAATTLANGAVTSESDLQDTGDSSSESISGSVSYASILRDYIVKKIGYPTKSKMFHEQGRVVIELTLKKNGEFTSVKILQGSTYERLNNEVLKSIQEIQNFPPFEQGSSDEEKTFQIPLDFKLD